MINKESILHCGILLLSSQSGAQSGTAGISIIDNVVNIFGTVHINGKSYSSHKHSGVTTGSGKTGGVTS